MFAVTDDISDDTARIKKELADQKKADEKMRRDAIFASYLARKTEDENPAEEEQVKKTTASPGGVTKRTVARGVKQPRPKSQPPPEVSKNDGAASTRRVESPASEISMSELCLLSPSLPPLVFTVYTPHLTNK